VDCSEAHASDDAHCACGSWCPQKWSAGDRGSAGASPCQPACLTPGVLQGREVEDGDVFRYNADFTAALFRVKINAIQLKETVEENKKTNDQVLQDRQYQARLPCLAQLTLVWERAPCTTSHLPSAAAPCALTSLLKVLQRIEVSGLAASVSYAPLLPIWLSHSKLPAIML